MNCAGVHGLRGRPARLDPSRLAAYRQPAYGFGGMQSRPRSPISRRARRVAARVAAGILAVIVLVGVLRGGARYFYCPMMQTIIDAPCCPGDGHPDDERATAAEARSRDCCEAHTLRTLPSGAVASAPTPCDAPLLAVLPRVTALSHPLSTVADPRFEREDRAGPASTARHRAELMAFLN